MLVGIEKLKKKLKKSKHSTGLHVFHLTYFLQIFHISRLSPNSDLSSLNTTATPQLLSAIKSNSEVKGITTLKSINVSIALKAFKCFNCEGAKHPKYVSSARKVVCKKTYHHAQVNFPNTLTSALTTLTGIISTMVF